MFALVNGLARSGVLSDDEQHFHRRTNDWFQANLIDPGRLVPSPYDRTRHPRAEAWFKFSADRFLERVKGYLVILEAHGIGWVRLTAEDPGHVLYEDPFQVIVDPTAEFRSA